MASASVDGRSVLFSDLKINKKLEGTGELSFIVFKPVYVEYCHFYHMINIKITDEMLYIF